MFLQLFKSILDAVERAKAYVNAGADAIMIHSKSKSAKEVFNFCNLFRDFDKKTPIVVVSTTYNDVTEEEFASTGVNIVIYANQLTRAAYFAMKKVAESILKNSRTFEIEKELSDINKIIRLVEPLDIQL